MDKKTITLPDEPPGWVIESCNSVLDDEMFHEIFNDDNEDDDYDMETDSLGKALQMVDENTVIRIDVEVSTGG